MSMEKAIGKRTKGMKFRTFNFHAALHIADDILDHGVPNVVNTKSNESHHKVSKNAALKTQKVPALFNEQVAKRSYEYHLTAMAMCECGATTEKLWDYFERGEENPEPSSNNSLQEHENLDGADDDNSMDPDTYDSDYEDNSDEEGQTFQQTAENSHDNDDVSSEDGDMSSKATDRLYNHDTKVSGLTVIYNGDYGDFGPRYVVISRMKNKSKVVLDNDMMNYLDVLMVRLNPASLTLTLISEVSLNNNIFRATPYYKGLPWQDWAVARYDNRDTLIHIWMFLDLRHHSPNELNGMQHGIYAIAETAYESRNREEKEMSQLFVPYIKRIVRTRRDNTIIRKFTLVNIDCIRDTAFVIPDIGSQNNAAFLKLRPQEDWVQLFRDWIQSEHTREFEEGQAERT